jgi:hypothetical protein
LLQVEDDNILEVVDVLLIRVNSWGPPIARNRIYLVVQSTAETVIILVNHKMMKDRGHGVLPTHARELSHPEISKFQDVNRKENLTTIFS